MDNRRPKTEFDTGNASGHVEELLPPGDAVDDTPSRDGNGSRASLSSEPEAPAEQELHKLKAERDSLFDRLARQQAELENFRKRTQKEQSEFREYLAGDFAKSLVPILDNFNLALKADGSAEDLRRGVDLIRKQMDEMLSKFGIQAIATKGRQFDPRQHEAIEIVETTAVPDNTILEELQRGYRIKDRLLRPARVRVARNPESRS